MPDRSRSVIYRAVHGAVRNVAHYHPEWRVPKYLASSVAKRAAGTLVGLLPGQALAASRRSQKQELLARQGSLVDGGSTNLEASVSARRLQAALREGRAIAHASFKEGDTELHQRACEAVRALKALTRAMPR